MGIIRFPATQLTVGLSLLASATHTSLLLWIVACTFLFQKLELWRAALFGVGYGSVLVAALAARAFNARLGTRLMAPLYWPPQSLAMLKALIDMKLKPQFWAKTQHGSAANTTLPGRLPQGRKPTTSSSWNSPYRTEAAPFRPSRR